MDCILKGCRIFTEKGFIRSDLFIKNGVISLASAPTDDTVGAEIYNFSNCVIVPGLIDVHVHLREPGFSYKETVATGSLAAAKGGYVCICAMPNLKPVPDCAQSLALEQAIIDKDAVITVKPYAAITKAQAGKELVDFASLDAVGFSDDGRGVQDDTLMRSAFEACARYGKMIVAHCEDEKYLQKGGKAHDGEFAKRYSLTPISSESEYKMLERDLRLLLDCGCKYHMCHVSAKESVELIRLAKEDGMDVSAETAPHYLLLDDSMLENEGRYKMNPPIRAAEDRLALITAIKDGTIEIIATDHAPHSEQEKQGDFNNSLNGIVGLETAFPALYTELVKTGVISLERLIALMSVNPAKRFNLEGGVIREGVKANLAVFDLDEPYVINSADFASMGHSTPFDNKRVYGRCLMTVCDGKIVYKA